MLFALFAILLTFEASLATTISEHERCITIARRLPNYYWRKYEGVIPMDAVPGGHTPSGEATYIGQVLVIGAKKDALLPGTINAGRQEVDAAFYGVYSSKSYTAILCSDTPSALKWRQTEADKIHLIRDYLVVGGFEISQIAYIGRVSYENHLIVGKVFTEEYKGLRIATPNRTEVVYSSFEVLVYEQY